MLNKKRKYVVISRGFNRETLEPIKIKGKVLTRRETIDLITDNLFNGKYGKPLKSIDDIAAKYEAFWNEMNPTSENIVKVVGVNVKF